MLRSPDNPNSKLRSRVLTATHRRRPEVTMADAYTFGIEEEYFLVDAQTKSVARDMPEGFLETAKEATNGQVRGEILQSQIEVATLPHHDIRTAHTELRHLRQTVAKIAAEHGLAILAAGTHPTADWGRSQQSRGRALRRRDGRPADDRPAQHAVRPARACRIARPGRPRRRDDAHAAVSAAVHRARDLLAVLALAADRAEGLSPRRLRRAAAHRRAGAVPHAGGIRRLYRGAGEGRRDGGFELRVVGDPAFAEASDAGAARARLCTLVEDSIAIAALYRSLARRLVRNPWLNCDINAVTRAIVVENKWRAQRYGVHGTFVGDNGAITVAEMLEQVVDETSADAEALGCLAEVQRCRTIVGSGTSADAQMAVFEEHGKTEGRARALRAVTDWLAATTLQ